MYGKFCQRMFSSVSMRTPANVHFITDTEGHFPFLVKSVQKSRVVTFDLKKRLQFQEDISNPYFVFGGDLTDRGVGDIQLAETLLDFKNRYPERVFLLVGNREASKTRFHVELNPRHIRQRLLNGSAPFWLLNSPHQLPVDYVKKHMNSDTPEEPDAKEIDQYVNDLTTEECQLIYLKWMLEQNLGCPHTFEYHAHQLADKQGCERTDITDGMVLTSIMKQNSPTGLMGQYLAQTQMVALIPDTGIMAIHGGLTPENIGRLPSMKPEESRIDCAHTWINKLNTWYGQAVTEWLSIEQENLPLELQPARTKLDTFSERVPSEYRSVVTASMLNGKRQFQNVPTEVSDYLQKSQISMVLTGHQPSGDHPVILRSEDDGVVFVNGDISYANARANNKHDTRGDAWHCIQIEVGTKVTNLSIHASLFTGKFLQHELKLVGDRVVDDTHIGKVLPGGELVQCRLPDSSYYRTIIQDGFNVTYKFRKEEEIDEILTELNYQASDNRNEHLVF